MVPLPIDNELDHTGYARRFIEKYALRYIGGVFPNHSDFFTLDLTRQRRNGYRLPDFAVLSVSRLRNGKTERLIHGFELKLPSGISANPVSAVNQAAAQKSILDSVFLILLLPEGVPAERQLDHLLREAKSHGIGVIRVKNWARGDEHQLLSAARVSAPVDPDGPEIIKSFMRRSDREIMRHWMTV